MVQLFLLIVLILVIWLSFYFSSSERNVGIYIFDESGCKIATVSFCRVPTRRLTAWDSMVIPWREISGYSIMERKDSRGCVSFLGELPIYG